MAGLPFFELYWKYPCARRWEKINHEPIFFFFSFGSRIRAIIHLLLWFSNQSVPYLFTLERSISKYFFFFLKSISSLVTSFIIISFCFSGLTRKDFCSLILAKDEISRYAHEFVAKKKLKQNKKNAFWVENVGAAHQGPVDYFRCVLHTAHRPGHIISHFNWQFGLRIFDSFSRCRSVHQRISHNRKPIPILAKVRACHCNIEPKKGIITTLH